MEIKIDLGDVLKRLGNLKNLLLENERFWNEVGAFQKAKIEVRTAEGKDYEGAPFKPYSAGYKITRQKAGRPVNRPDLNFKGHMLASMNVKVMKGPIVKLGFPAVQSLKAAYNNRTREFFRVSEQDKKKVIEMVTAETDRLIREAMG